MSVSSKFTIAIHTLLCIYRFSGSRKVTSGFIAGSVGVNPVIIRRTLLNLKSAGMVEVAAGTGGARPLKKPESVSLYDIYAAVSCTEKNIFNFHEQPNGNCPVGRNIHAVLDSRLRTARNAFENSLRQMSLAGIIADLDRHTQQDRTQCSDSGIRICDPL